MMRVIGYGKQKTQFRTGAANTGKAGRGNKTQGNGKKGSGAGKSCSR
jgi:hypothetical protein